MRALKKNSKRHIAQCPFFRLRCGLVAPTSMQFYADGLPLKSYGWSVFLCLFLPVTQAMSTPICATLDLQLSFYCPLCYNSRAQSSMVSSFICEEKICHDLLPNSRRTKLKNKTFIMISTCGTDERGQEAKADKRKPGRGKNNQRKTKENLQDCVEKIARK